MKTISQRELRNDNAVVMRGGEQGEAFTVTRRGVPLARPDAVGGAEDLRCVRPASGRPVYSQTPRLNVDTDSAAILDELRGER